MRLLIITLLLSVCINSEKIFVSCEGNFYDGNQGSLWTISDNEIHEYPNNPIGSVVQSLYVYEDLLFVVVNGSSNIQIFQITESSLTPIDIVDTGASGPREMVVYNNKLYFTNWYSMDIKKLNLQTLQIESSIQMPGLPEDIIYHDGLLYISITMNSDWSDGNQVVVVSPVSETVVDSFEVGLGPGNLVVHNDELYVSRTYYDSSWNAFYGTSKIKTDGTVIVENYGSGAVCGGSLHTYQSSIYRTYEGGIAKLDDDLQIIPDSKIGDYAPEEIYSSDVFGEIIYFGLSDFLGNDEVAVVGEDGVEIARYAVGSLPGDFALWNSCENSGDLNDDTVVDIIDVVSIVNFILSDLEYACNADFNSDGYIDILDIVQMVQLILS